MKGREPVRQARSLLFLIESRTAYLAARARHALERFPAETLAEERDLAFLENYLLGREPKEPPTIQDIERFADHWRDLLPENPRIRASLARLLGEKYRLSRGSTPGIQAALGLDEPAVRDAFERFTGKSIDELFTERLGWREGLRWRWTALARWLDSLPPFWTAYTLTLTEAVGGAMLALPIGLVVLGPLAGLLMLVAVGLINVATIGYLAESLVRSGAVRYDSAYYGRMVGSYLGKAGSLLLTAILFTVCILISLIYYQGVSTTLADATGIPAPVWAAGLFVIAVFFVTRPSLNSTVASALVLGSMNMLLIVLISLVSLRHFHAANLADASLPFGAGSPLWRPETWGGVFGVVLSIYYGHVSVGNCGRLVLSRDPSGRSLIQGSMAALGTAIVLYAGFFIAVTGAVPRERLLAETGPVLIPLAERTGPGVQVLGSLFAVLSMGLAMIYVSLGLFNLVRERLPRPLPALSQANERKNSGGINMVALLSLPDEERRVAALLLRKGETTAADLRSELGITDDALQKALAELGRLGYVEERVDANGQRCVKARLGHRTPARTDGASMWNVLEEEQSAGQKRRATKERRGTKLGPGSHRGGAAAVVRSVSRPLEKLGQQAARWSESTRFWVSLSPVIACFLGALWLLTSGSNSFTQVVNFTGVFTVTVFAGFFPVWLVVSSRRKGDLVPGTVYRLIGHPLVIGGLYAFYVGVLLLYGFVIWRGQPAGVFSLGLALAIVALTVVMARTGAFDRHAAVELRTTDDGQGFFSIVTGGQHPRKAQVVLARSGAEAAEDVRDTAQGEVARVTSLRELRFRFPAAEMKAVGIRTHHVNTTGDSQPLPCTWEVHVVPEQEEAARGDAPSPSSPSQRPPSHEPPADPSLSHRPPLSHRPLATGERAAGMQTVPLPPAKTPMVEVTMRLPKKAN